MSDGAPFVLELAPRRLEPCHDVVEVLRAALVRAEAGEIRGCALAVACDAHKEGTVYAFGDQGVAPLVLALRRLELRILAYEP